MGQACIGFHVVQRKVEVRPSSRKEFVSVATFLPVKSWRNVIPFFRVSSKVQAQLQASEGVVRFGVRTDFPHKRFWTLSVWDSVESMHAFVKAEPHATAVAKFKEWAGEGAAFAQWEGSDGLIDWTEAARRLQNPTFHYKR